MQDPFGSGGLGLLSEGRGSHEGRGRSRNLPIRCSSHPLGATAGRTGCGVRGPNLTPLLAGAPWWLRGRTGRGRRRESAIRGTALVQEGWWGRLGERDKGTGGGSLVGREEKDGGFRLDGGGGCG